MKSGHLHNEINLKTQGSFISQVAEPLRCRHYSGNISNFGKKKAGCSPAYLPFSDSYCFPYLKTKPSYWSQQERIFLL